MYENLELLSLIAVPFYIIFFHIVGFVLGRHLWDLNPHEHPNWEIIYKAGLRGEQISYTLTGFAILALVFIISIFIDDLANAELVIVFFSLGFILEVFSAFLFHFFTKLGFQMSASTFQYGGLFAILLGFYTYLTNTMEWSILIHVVYISGVVGFVILSGKELHVYINYAKIKDKDE